MNIGVLVAVAAASISVISAYFIRSQVFVERQSLALETYDKAVRAVLELKADFAAHPEIFADQRSPTQTWERYEAEGMDAEEFLLFAQGLWRLSYAYSVARRGQVAGLRRAETDALRREVKLWALFPGFHWIFEHYAEQVAVHNAEFRADFRRLYANQDEEDPDLNPDRANFGAVLDKLFPGPLDGRGRRSVRGSAASEPVPQAITTGSRDT